jgi:NNP family nitrate/nitrite transporter-like MFS transporter
VVPVVIAGGALHLAGFVWAPLIVLCSAAVWFGMNDLAQARGSFAEQAVIFRRKHNWLMCWLYGGCFGSFIGFAAAMPLLLQQAFPQHGDLLFAMWLGPLVGALMRPLGGWLADRHGGARVTLWTFAAMSVGIAALIAGLPGRFALVVGALALLFVAAGIGNGSTFRMIPVIFGGGKEAAAVLGFSSAVGAYGGFFIPKALGTAVSLSGQPHAALWVFLAFYLSCLAITWWYYARRFAPMPC